MKKNTTPIYAKYIAENAALPHSEDAEIIKARLGVASAMWEYGNAGLAEAIGKLNASVQKPAEEMAALFVSYGKARINFQTLGSKAEFEKAHGIDAGAGRNS